jgi:hypothetical protein
MASPARRRRVDEKPPQWAGTAMVATASEAAAADATADATDDEGDMAAAAGLRGRPCWGDAVLLADESTGKDPSW